jgi:hypothetical protein
MWKSVARHTAIQVALFLAVLANPALADEKSPWFGSADQQPFQLEISETVTVSSAVDHLQTGSLCQPEACAQPSAPAKSGTAAGGSPQN